MEHLLAKAEEGIDLDKTIGKLFCVYTIIIRNSQTNLFIIDKSKYVKCLNVGNSTKMIFNDIW